MISFCFCIVGCWRCSPWPCQRQSRWVAREARSTFQGQWAQPHLRLRFPYRLRWWTFLWFRPHLWQWGGCQEVRAKVQISQKRFGQEARRIKKANQGEEEQRKEGMGSWPQTCQTQGQEGCRISGWSIVMVPCLVRMLFHGYRWLPWLGWFGIVLVLLSPLCNRLNQSI